MGTHAYQLPAELVCLIDHDLVWPDELVSLIGGSASFLDSLVRCDVE